jgi:hypothetical protein
MSNLPELAGRAARSALRITGVALAVALGVALLPFWALGFAAQGAIAAFEHGRSTFNNIDSDMGKP